MARHHQKLATTLKVAMALLLVLGSVGPAKPAEAGTTNGQSARTASTNHWAFKPVVRPTVPRANKTEAKWCRTAVDNFVAQGLTKQKITPAREDDRTTLVRRIYFDLIGLLPSPEEVTSFVEDKRSDA